MRRPLEGRSILVTRPGAAGAELALMLAGLGARTGHRPTFETRRLPAATDLDRRLAGARGLLISSKRGLEALLEERPEIDRGLVAHCVGRASAEAARAAGFRVGVVAEKGGLEHLVADLLAETEPAELRLFWPASALSEAGPLRPLEAQGAVIDRMPLYQPRSILAVADLAEILTFEVFVFASPSALEGLFAVADADQRRELGGRVAIAIGATTAYALRAVGWERIHVAQRPDNEGLLAICLEQLAAR